MWGRLQSARGFSPAPFHAGENFPFRRTLTCVPVYHRRLPHIYQIGQPLFITWRLAGSLPVNRPFRNADTTSGQAFAVLDRLLDTARTGPLLLNQPALAGLVMAYLMRLAQSDGIYDLHAFAIMPNHVHALFTPNVPLPNIMKRVKVGTARLANEALGTTGRSFWQDESYDHCVRDRDEFEHIRRYIELNPVGAAPLPRQRTFHIRAHRSPGRAEAPRRLESAPHQSAPPRPGSQRLLLGRPFRNPVNEAFVPVQTVLRLQNPVALVREDDQLRRDLLGL